MALTRNELLARHNAIMFRFQNCRTQQQQRQQHRNTNAHICFWCVKMVPLVNLNCCCCCCVFYCIIKKQEQQHTIIALGPVIGLQMVSHMYICMIDMDKKTLSARKNCSQLQDSLPKWSFLSLSPSHVFVLNAQTFTLDFGQIFFCRIVMDFEHDLCSFWSHCQNCSFTTSFRVGTEKERKVERKIVCVCEEREWWSIIIIGYNFVKRRLPTNVNAFIFSLLCFLPTFVGCQILSILLNADTVTKYNAKFPYSRISNRHFNDTEISLCS